MKIQELSFSYPEELIAQFPVHPPRVLWVEPAFEPKELQFAELLQKFSSGDTLVINDTKVLRRRIFTENFEILFLGKLESGRWQVLFPSKNMKLGEMIDLPEGRKIKLVEKGRPQIIELMPGLGELDDDYFERVGELPLPPYIQKARGERHQNTKDASWYQTAWAEAPGSLAAPTASLHFSKDDIQTLRDRGVQILNVTLHVGLGTFLPVTTENLEDHKIHEEWVEIPTHTVAELQRILKVRSLQRASETPAAGRVWALGTTVVRSVESWAAGRLQERPDGSAAGFSNLFIRPGFDFKVITGLLTNFHQPESTLLALVAAFSSLEQVKACYDWAIQHRFRLFSYGDLTVWTKK